MEGFETNFHNHFSDILGEIGKDLGGFGRNLGGNWGGRPWKTRFYIKNMLSYIKKTLFYIKNKLFYINIFVFLVKKGSIINYLTLRAL